MVNCSHWSVLEGKSRNNSCTPCTTTLVQSELAWVALCSSLWYSINMEDKAIM